MNISPIALFVYNRLEHTRKVIDALLKNELAAQSHIYIFSDAPASEKHREQVDRVRGYIKKIAGFKGVEIIEQSVNKGLSASIIEGVTGILASNERVIVLEDDLVTSPYFLRYMNRALELYENEERVISVHAYIYPVKEKLPETFFLRGADCWGWGTWRRGWKFFEPDGRRLLSELNSRKLTSRFDFNNSYPYTKMLKEQIKGKNNSWAIRWYASAFLHDKLTLYPGRSLVNNIGIDNSGTHCANNSENFEVFLSATPVDLKKLPCEENEDAFKVFEKYFESNKKPLILRAVNFLKRAILKK